MAVELFWATLGGLAVRHLLVYLRSRHAQAIGLDVFLGLDLIGTAYGVTQWCGASGFLALFAAAHCYQIVATHSHHASATMRHSVEGFNEQIEKIAEVVVDAMLPSAGTWGGSCRCCWCCVPRSCWWSAWEKA